MISSTFGITNGLLRCCVLLVGLFIMALGIALSIKTNLGTTPISCVPYVYSLGFAYTMGQLTIALHVLLIALQVLLLRRRFELVQLLQLPLALVFGVFTDCTLYLVSAKSFLDGYFVQQAVCVGSALLIAFGVSLEVKAGVIYLAGEGAVLAITRTFGTDFGKTKVAFDCTLVAFGAASSLALVNGVQGIREGTVLSALLVGWFVRSFMKRLAFVDAWVAR